MPDYGGGLSVLEANHSMNMMGRRAGASGEQNLVKLANVKFKNKKHVKNMIQQERVKYKNEKRRAEEKR